MEKKKDRTTWVASAILVGVVFNVWGMSHQQPFVQWGIPAVLVLCALIYSFVPRRGASGAAGSGADPGQAR